MTTLWSIGLVVLSTIIGAFGPILFKKGSTAFTLNPRKIIKKPFIILQNYNVIGGCMLYALSAFVFIFALRGGELSVLYPIASLAYVWVTLLSIKLLGEHVNTTKLAGIMFVIMGVMLIGIGQSS